VAQVDPSAPTLIRQRWLEVLVGLIALAFGLAIIAGALEYNVSWGERGPEPGYFPFWTGTVVVIGALGAIASALLSRRTSADVPAIDLAQARRIAAFLVPLVGFLVLALMLKLGLYVAMVLYLLLVMLAQGGFRPLNALVVSIGAAVAFYAMFDRWLKVPLMKGPLEAWLGLH
jgi:hypothetical protein